MENPFLHAYLKIKDIQNNISQKFLSIVIFVLSLIILVLPVFIFNASRMHAVEIIRTKTVQPVYNINIDKTQLYTNKEVVQNIQCMNIKDFILEQNTNITDTQANKLAKVIVKESAKNEVSPYFQAALINSESSFRFNVKHDISNVIGISGIYWTVWSDRLKNENICWNKNDLNNPYTNIAASSFIFGYYNKMSSTPREAISRYKGFCTLGKKQAAKVTEIAVSLKSREKLYFS